MNPDQAQWQGNEGSTQKVTLELECRPDGIIQFQSGTYKFEGTDPQQAGEQVIRLVQHGLEHAAS